MTLSQFLEQIYPLLLNGTLKKVEQVLETGEKVTAYRIPGASLIIRVDIKPQ